MNLTTGYPYWLINSGLVATYPKLEQSIKTDVVIIGGGISGALSACYLSNAGLECKVVDARTIGLGSTCASTSLLQYELDKPLSVVTLKWNNHHVEPVFNFTFHFTVSNTSIYSVINNQYCMLLNNGLVVLMM